MLTKKSATIVFVVIFLILVGWVISLELRRDKNLATNSPSSSSSSVSSENNVKSFSDCVAAGYPLIPGPPRQCTTPDGRRYAEEVPEKATYQNASADMIKVELPFPGAVVGKEFKVKGQARGGWFSEASFPVVLLDKDGNMLASATAKAQGEWMTENFVPFEADLKAPDSYIGPATLVLKKDNPSGLPANEASISLGVTVEY